MSATDEMASMATRLLPRAALPGELSGPERLALLACALLGPRALGLLEHLAPGPRLDALALAQRVLSEPSPARRSRVQLELGLHPEAVSRLADLLDGLTPPMASLVGSRLPQYLRPLGAERLAAREGASEPGRVLSLVIARLTREATR